MRLEFKIGVSFFAPKQPAIPPLQPVPQASDDAVQQARADEIKARRKAVGRSALILSGGGDVVGDAPTIKTRLLGGG